MKTGIAAVAVKDLVAVLVGRTKTDLAVSLEELPSPILAFGWLKASLTLEKLSQLLFCLVGMTQEETFQHCWPCKHVPDLRYFSFSHPLRPIFRVHFDWFQHSSPPLSIGLVHGLQLLLPQLQLFLEERALTSTWSAFILRKGTACLFIFVVARQC